MTEAEIMKAWEYCATGGKCGKCPLFEIPGCNLILSKATIDLINRKNAEIERLEKSKRLADELIEQMRITINNRTTENQKLKLNNEELKIINKNLDKLFLKAKAEAIKEFAERVKQNALIGNGYEVLQQGTIDQIAKEMGGGVDVLCSVEKRN